MNHTIASFTLTISRKWALRLYESSMLVLSPVGHRRTHYLIIMLNYSEMHGTISRPAAQTSSSLDFVAGLILEYDHQKMPV